MRKIGEPLTDGDLYSAEDVIDKTLIADKELKVYDSAPDKNHIPKQIGIVKKGNPAGIVYSYLSPDPLRNRPTLWWLFYPASGLSDYYLIPHEAGAFDISALREQGVVTVAEKIEEEKEKEEEANKEWWEKLADKAVPVILVLGLGTAVITGILSRKKTQ